MRDAPSDNGGSPASQHLAPTVPWSQECSAPSKPNLLAGQLRDEPDRSGWLEYPAGAVLAVSVTAATAAVVWGLVSLAGRIGGGGTLLIQSLLVYWGLAIRSLGEETLRASEAPDIVTARRELAMIVGRDTAALEQPEINRACVETVAENGNDAVVAPLFWFAIGGVVGLWAYKAVNTLDSMVGYRNERYRRLGWTSARLDDVANLIPARLTWLTYSLASLPCRERAFQALRIGWRDGRSHPSPNAAWGEAAMAGALGVQLGGTATYQGVPSMKPLLGDLGDPLDSNTVRRALTVMWVAAAFVALVAWLTRIWVIGHA
jgi:adenosylcobinamide-phosphate synthase